LTSTIEKKIASEVLDAVKNTIGITESLIPLHEPEFSGCEWNYVKECIDTGWVSSAGSYVEQFENSLADFIGVQHAVATTNGTAALHLALILAGIKPEEEIIVPALSFVAAANAVRYCNAFPHFVDISMDNFGIDPTDLENYFLAITEKTSKGLTNRQTGRRISAILPIHAFGHPADIDGLLSLSKKLDVPLIEDSAEALGSTYKGKHCGSFGKLSVLSFNGNKVVTTGGGGALLTDNKGLAKRAKHLSTTAKLPHKWSYFHDEVGYNYRMPNINAALGCAQLEQLPNWITEKRKLAEKYAAVFKNVPGVRFVKEPDKAKSNYWLNAIIIEDGNLEVRDAILKQLNDADYMSRPTWTLLCDLPPFADCPRMSNLEKARRVEKSLINLPSSPRLSRRLI
jgi:perosamine synthetase